MLKFMYITNRPEIAEIAENAGVDRIFIDLEQIGKAERQEGMDTVQSLHSLDDIKKVKSVLSKAELLVRSNPIHEGSREEIDTIIENGANIVMLPFFKTVNEVAKFIDLVNGRAQIMLLVETAEAVEKLDAILELDGIDEIHIGLNDLHLAYHMKFMFELLANGTVEYLGKKILKKRIPFGFGGIAQLGSGMLPAEHIIKEHYRIGSSIAILSRSFCNVDTMFDLHEIEKVFNDGMIAIRNLEREIMQYKAYFLDNERTVVQIVKEIVS
ncbi:hypothetical protein C799_00999 [Bacteroides thetaiotaomicron dnLKV9]|uniref:HpcH/HpaI aldolase/citrate lyase domain-containing protein n=1 Tax=Bacteroides thetaiotaomicron dnLKV9 TaxID=1235785 RepID=R9HCX8_BACT4|nr:aldolase/citrate lyase family protein [Bacteroides thetaiotaomicron]EOS01892.1 hypothetical protein C799_00999 [Bacteroides thetaiotaomicron dnLKV9]